MRALVLLVAGLVLLGSPVTVEGREPPGTLAQLDKRLRDVTTRLEALVAEAKRDPNQRKLKIYLKYSAKEMKSSKREVRAEDLVEWMSNPEAKFEFRLAVKEALKRGATFLQDPDLSSNIKKGSGTNRGHFFRNKIVPLLKKDDRNTRTLAASLLFDVFGRLAGQKDIFRYNADDKSTWHPAYAQWRKHLKKL